MLSNRAGSDFGSPPARHVFLRIRESWIWLLLFSALATPDLVAHDFWIQPLEFRIRVGSAVPVQLFVGDRFHQGTPFARDPSHIRRFIAVGPAGQILLSIPSGRLSRLAYGRRGGAQPAVGPAAYLQPQEPGLYVIGYESNPTQVALEAERFAGYLAEEGLERLLDAPSRQKEDRTQIIELYSRCAKSLLAVGDIDAVRADTDVVRADAQLGFSLELIAEKNPYAMSGKGRLPVRILFQGEPLPGALVSALNQSHPEQKVRARSDPEGRAVLSLSGGGIWMGRAVHMVPAHRDTSAHWRSYWASLTFETADYTD